MGRVWLARDEMLHRDVAVKELVRAARPAPTTNAGRCANGRCARRGPPPGCGHPNVVRVFDVIEAERPAPGS